MPKPHPGSVGISRSAALRTFKQSCKGARKVLPVNLQRQKDVLGKLTGAGLLSVHLALGVST